MILHGDCLEKLKEFEPNSIDSVATDPPYGLKFMGKKWDYDVPSVEMWREVLRVLKPGGHLLSFGGTRTYHRMVMNIEDAGFEIRDQIQWLYGSGFPKSHNGDHGGTALKPANEPIVLARKPLSEKTIALNFQKWGVGGLNIDASRIGPNPGYKYPNGPGGNSFSVGKNPDGSRLEPVESNRGRWPANVLLGCNCEGAIHGQMCAVHLLDEQSGNRPSRGAYKNRSGERYKVDGVTWKHGGNVENTYANEQGGASRFFYVAKASKRERNAGLEGMPEKLAGAISGKETRPDRPPNHTMRANHHPTVKPIKLMEYLIKLITPKGGVVLDPFAGSGSTGVAAKRLGFKFIGIEMNEEYVEIAKKRLGLSA